MNEAKNILILTGIGEELHSFLKVHPMEFSRELRLYRSRIYPHLYAATTGPGVRKRKEILRWLRTLRPAIVINAGLTGILSRQSGVRSGAMLEIGTVLTLDSDSPYRAGAGKDLLVSIGFPLFDADEKEELHVRTGAGFCDMEAGPLIELMEESGKESTTGAPQLLFCKIAGERPEEGPLYASEHLIRGWAGKGVWEKVGLALRFPGGPLQFLRLRRKKEALLRSLARSLNSMVQDTERKLRNLSL